MDKNVNPVWRLTLPDDWSPEGFWCVQIAIPADQQYMDALTAVLGLLTIQKTWARDDTRTGARIVAKVWRDALYTSPFQVSTNCFIVPVPPIPDQDAANDAAAAIITLFYRHVVHSLNVCATTQALCNGCVDSLMGELGPYGAGDAVRAALSQLCTGLNQLTPSQREEYETDCRFIAMYDDIRNQIASNPENWLNMLSDWLIGLIGDFSDAILDDLNWLGGAFGGHGISGFIDSLGGIPPGGGAGFGSTCPWTIRYQFGSDEQGWTMHPVDFNPEGEYLTSSHWGPTDGQYANTKWARQLNIHYDTGGNVEVTAIRVHYYMLRGVPDGIPDDFPFVYVARSYSGGGGTRYEVTVDGYGDLEVPGTFTQDGFYCAANCNIRLNEDPTLSGAVQILWYEVDGIGRMPNT